MSYKVLYRKYRPKTFNDIIDQNFITDTLKESIINNRISHAYIFSGPKGTGKTSTAKVFAKAINCENPIDGEPCGKCNSCINFSSNPDIIELDAASNNKVEDIREIINNVKLAPTSSKFKIYIIDEAHMLTNSASNAFLLTLEEPPAHAIFILATTNPESLPQTILSRCQHFAFSKISKKALINRIKYVLDHEKINIDDQIIEEIASLADGGLRDALSILDQLVTLNKPITIELLTEQFGVVSENSIEQLLDSIIQNDINKIISLFVSYKEYGLSEKSFIAKLVTKLTEFICKLKMESKNDDVSRLKDILCEIIQLDVNKTSFNYYDVIESIIVSHLVLKNDKEIISWEINNDNLSLESNINMDKQQGVDVSNEVDESIEIKNNLPKVNNNLKQIVDIRINNSFYGATKKCKTDAENKYNQYLECLKNENDIYSLMLDTKVGVVSPTNILIVCDSSASANLLNEKYNKIVNCCSFDNKTPVFVSEDKWTELKEMFQENKQKGIEYKYIEEPERITNDVLLEMADDIFGNNIIVEE